MSRPRFLADHDLSESIVLGALRRQPAMEFRRLRDELPPDTGDFRILEYAAQSGLLVVSHDVNTMTPTLPTVSPSVFQCLDFYWSINEIPSERLSMT